MSSLHRIQWIDQQIRAENYPNSTLIAKKFEISKRQAQRDIEYMEMSMHAPLFYVAKKRGYCYEDDTYVLPNVYITEEEQKILKYLAHRYRNHQYESSRSIRRVAHLLEHFSESGDGKVNEQLPVFDVLPLTIHNMELLSHAIEECNTAYITYRNREGEKEYYICPLQMTSRYNSDYVIAYCDQQDKQLSFRLDDILHVRVTAIRFERTADMEVEIERGKSPLLQPFVAKLKLQHEVNQETWMGYRIISREGSYIDVEFYDTASFLQHLLISEWEALLSPHWLRNQLSARCQRTLASLDISTTNQDESKS